jgi:hypothetical protein
MFTFVKAMVSLRGANQRLAETDIRNTLVRDLMTKYSSCILILSHPSIDHPVSLDVSKVETMFYQASPNLTVVQWLTAIGDSDIPFDLTVPTVVKSSVMASEAYAAGYNVQRIHPLAGEGNQYPDPELTHLRLTRPDTDYMDVFNNCLASVNGLLHLTDAGTDGFRVIDGGKSVHLSGRNEVGLISFKNVGKIKCYPVTASMITGRKGLPLTQGAVLTAPAADFGNKYVMLVVGGYLHTAGNQYKVVGKNSVMLEWWKLPVGRRYNDTRKLIDWTPVTKLMDRNLDHTGAIDLNLMNTDACIKAYLTMSNTFIITVDSPNLFFENIPVERTGLAGRYYSYVPPVKPLLMANGFLPPYTIHGNNGMYCMAVDVNNMPQYLHDTRNVMDGDAYENDAIVRAPNKEYASAYFMDIFNERLKY